MIDSETLIVTASAFNRRRDTAVMFGRRMTVSGVTLAFGEAMELASQCWDAQKYYANECERLREELRQMRTPSPTTTERQGETK